MDYVIVIKEKGKDICKRKVKNGLIQLGILQIAAPAVIRKFLEDLTLKCMRQPAMLFKCN